MSNEKSEKSNYDLKKNHSYVNSLKIKLPNLQDFLFCACVISIFLPVKVYPIIFLVSSLIFLNPIESLKFKKWTFFLITYITYTFLIFVFRSNYNFFVISNIIKLTINFIFLISVISWIQKRSNDSLLYWLDKSFHVVFFLTFLQLLLYHFFSGFKYLTNIESSSEASLLYNHAVYFWGVFDKNMIGAKIALLGYIYIILAIVLKNKISIIRIAFILTLSYLSLSRTPIAIISIGLFYVLFTKAKFFQKASLITICLIGLPFVLNKVIRIDNFTELNDGMGIRILYWTTFFNNLNHISPFGNGFLAAGSFLEKYSYYYNGEPNLHNTFLNTYLDLGFIGLLSYSLFLIFIILYTIRVSGNKILTMVCFIPLVANMMILFTGYDNDVIVYISITFLLCTYRKVELKNLKWSLL